MFKEYKLRGWSTFYFYVVILVCAACTSTCEHGEVIDSDVERQLDSLQASLSDLNVDEVKANHLVDLLRPVMLSSIEEFEVESWYINNKPDWLAEFGEQEIVHLCSEILFNKYLQQKDSVSAAKIMLNIGWLHFIDTNYAASIEAQKEALNLSDRADIVAWATNNIGAVLAQTNQLDAGKEYFDEVLSTPGVDSMPGVRAVSQMNLGIVHIVTGNLDAGLEFIEKAKLAVSGLGLTHIAEVVQLSHAFLLLNINEVDESIRLLEGMSGFNDGAVNRNNIFLNIYLSKAFLIKNDVDASSFYLDRACEMSEKLDLDFGRMTCWRLKMSLHERLEEYDNALNASQKYYDLRDEQEGSKTVREIQALEAKLIQDTNEEIEEANRILLASEERSQNLERQIISYSLFLFAALVLAFLFMRFKNKARLTAQRKSRAEAKLMLLQTQMSPHFLFNALGGIQNYILKSEKRVAYNYMGQFESMLRNLAESSGQVEVGLDEEIEFIRNYLELEKLRFRDEFDYSIVVDEKLEGRGHQIPSMVIQPVVENAMIHGLAGLDRKGLLELRICPFQNGVRCVVKDNGRGREAAAKLREKTGQKKHLSISTLNTSKRLECLRKIGYANAKLEIEDLYEGPSPEGTSVTIYLPFMEKEKMVEV